MTSDDNPSETRAKMIALLSLLDVLKGDAIMSAVAIDRVGHFGAARFGGKVRLKFSVFGDDARLLHLADELTTSENVAALLLRRGLDIPDKIRFAMDRIDAWTEVVRRMLDLQPERRGLPPGVPELPSGYPQLPERKP